VRDRWIHWLGYWMSTWKIVFESRHGQRTFLQSGTGGHPSSHSARIGPAFCRL